MNVQWVKHLVGCWKVMRGGVFSYKNDYCRDLKV
jgi:hypothetical protein